MTRALVLFRQDLRIHDNPALYQAVKAHPKIIPLYILDQSDSHWEMGAASRWWLHHSLKALESEFAEKGVKFYVLNGPTEKILVDLVKKHNCQALYSNALYEPTLKKKDKDLFSQLEKLGCSVHVSDASTLFVPGTVVNPKGGVYQVFTPFWKTCLKEPAPRAPFPAPKNMKGESLSISSERIDALKLLPQVHWDKGFHWHPGEKGAKQRLEHFIAHGLKDYATLRDYPAVDGVSRLSPHLHFGEISPFQIWEKVSKEPHSIGRDVFLKELGWREFAYNLLFAFPKTPEHALREKFEDFPWKRNAKLLTVWQKGMTGYPIVDAGMRQLWKTGWMHNRVRMIVGSFLVKDLMIPWQEGAKWFWDTLVDADLASNTLGWQWIAGCGADAAPYFRVFNPILQGEKFDADGDYVREFVPELSKMPREWIHKPWKAPGDVLQKAGVSLGKDYPHPIVEHAEAKDRALKLYHEWAQKTG